MEGMAVIRHVGVHHHLWLQYPVGVRLLYGVGDVGLYKGEIIQLRNCVLYYRPVDMAPLFSLTHYVFIMSVIVRTLYSLELIMCFTVDHVLVIMSIYVWFIYV
jgi:hypothetical protein